jgi:hypothetical protein
VLPPPWILFSISSLGSNDDDTDARAGHCMHPKQSARPRHQAGALLPAAAAPSASPQTVRASVTPGHGPYIAWIRRGHSLFIPIGITQDYIRHEQPGIVSADFLGYQQPHFPSSVLVRH